MILYNTPRNHSAANRDARERVAMLDSAIDAIHGYPDDCRDMEIIQAQRARREQSRDARQRLLSRYMREVQ